jgi:microcystin-dependent protein
MTFWKWSTTAANNGTADSTCPFPEGMAPSAVNDGTRGMMAAAAKYRDDIAGILVTAGTSTAYTISSNQGFDSFAAMHGAMICFTPHTTNGANGTSLNVDAKGPKPILTAPGVGLPGAVLVQGTPYAVTYNNTDGAFYLHGYFNDPYNVPLLGGMDYWDTVTPNSSFIFPLGQAISRTTYAYAFSRWGTTHGAGDGSTTFNVPNKAGRVSAMLDAAGTVLTSATMTPNGNTIGAKGGAQVHTLQTTEIPSHTHANTLSDPGHSHSYNAPLSFGASGSGAGINGSQQTSTTSPSATGIAINNAAAGGGGAHNNVQPTIVCNYIIRII